MPIRYAGKGKTAHAIFEGVCAPEEADGFLDWLRRTPSPRADLAACETLHTALAQLLLAARVRVRPPPPDATLACCLGAQTPKPGRTQAVERP